MRPVVQAQCPAVLADLPKLLDAAVPLRNLLRPMGAFRARYFLLDDPWPRSIATTAAWMHWTKLQSHRSPPASYGQDHTRQRR